MIPPSWTEKHGDSQSQISSLPSSPQKRKKLAYSLRHVFLPPPPPPRSRSLVSFGFLRRHHGQRRDLRSMLVLTLAITLSMNVIMMFVFSAVMSQFTSTRSMMTMIVEPNALFHDLVSNSSEKEIQDLAISRSMQYQQDSELPTWILDYTAWHRSCRKEMEQNATAWRKYNYLILRCLNRDESCGGLADRRTSFFCL